MLRASEQVLFDFPIPTINDQAATRDELFAPFWDSWTLLHETFPDALDDDALMNGALAGMVEGIGDPNTAYWDPETYALVFERMSAEYEGIGAVVRQDETTGGLELVSIFDDSPAQQMGLRVGDQIVQVDGEDVTVLSQNEIIALVRGPAGSTVQLGILRPGEAEILQFEVVRARISVPSVSSEVLEGNIGYVRLSQFEFNTSQEMRMALQAMDADHLNGLILDVRGNPGGYLVTSIEVASAFIPEGVILYERTTEEEFPHMALGNAIATNVPMVLLVDQGSASASELIAGALQDHGRATIVGMPTFGKGSVQVQRELSNGGGLSITIGRWFTPNKTSVNERGIIPDIEVPYSPVEVSGDEDNQLTAAIQVLNGTYQESASEGDTTTQ
jgi:carboxyl-terminal processing protease